jgi:hypothetical protein
LISELKVKRVDLHEVAPDRRRVVVLECVALSQQQTQFLSRNWAFDSHRKFLVRKRLSSGAVVF